MNYLIQAFACLPNKGGEFAVSWGWITHLDKHVRKKDRIYVLSKTLKKSDIDAAKLKNVQLIDIEETKYMLKYQKKFGYNAFYHIMWMKAAYNTILKSKLKIDVVHIYSLSDFRKIGLWYKMKDVYMILGPVGGGQNTPINLWNYENLKGMIREIINLSFKVNLIYKYRVKKFSKVYVCNKETQSYINHSKILIDVPLNERNRNLNIISTKNKMITVIFAGRLIQKKGLLFLLDVLTNIHTKKEWILKIYGEGEQKQEIEKKINELHLQNHVKMEGMVNYDEMSRVYEQGDIFVLPSLRESGGSVLIEAMAHKLPIVALDMGMAHLLKEKECGLFVNTKQKKKSILKEFSKNITQYIENDELRKCHGSNGYRFVNENLNWEKMLEEVYGDFIDTNN